MNINEYELSGPVIVMSRIPANEKQTRYKDKAGIYNRDNQEMTEEEIEKHAAQSLISASQVWNKLQQKSQRPISDAVEERRGTSNP